MRTGDTVLHAPTQETWTVAFVIDDRLSWLGWPPGYAKAADCALVKSCTDEEHLFLLMELAEMNLSNEYDERKSHAQWALDRMGYEAEE